MDRPVADDEPGAVGSPSQVLFAPASSLACGLDHLPTAFDTRVEQPFPQLRHEFVLAAGIFGLSLPTSPRSADLVSPEAKTAQLIVGLTCGVELVAVDRPVGDFLEIGSAIDLRVSSGIDVRLVGLEIHPSIHPIFWMVITYRYIGGFT